MKLIFFMGAHGLELQNGKHYFVKYKGLAHIHNQWISETQMLQEAPTLLSKFKRKYYKERVGYLQFIFSYLVQCKVKMFAGIILD